MEWSDEAIVLGTRRHGENNLILEAMTRTHGRHLGLVRGGAGPRLRPLVQAGNSVSLTWRARLEDHLGNFAVEPLRSRAAALLGSAAGLNGVSLLACHLRLLAEREPHEGLYQASQVLLDSLDEPFTAALLMIRFELALLDELGFGLDLTQCAATGASDDLTHVSPKSARAVGRIAAQPYLDKLLPLPGFLLQATSGRQVAENDIATGSRLTGFFLTRHVYEVRALAEPDCRAGFFHHAALTKPRHALAALSPEG